MVVRHQRVNTLKSGVFQKITKECISNCNVVLLETTVLFYVFARITLNFSAGIRPLLFLAARSTDESSISPCLYTVTLEWHYEVTVLLNMYAMNLKDFQQHCRIRAGTK